MRGRVGRRRRLKSRIIQDDVLSSFFPSVFSFFHIGSNDVLSGMNGFDLGLGKGVQLFKTLSKSFKNFILNHIKL